MKFLISLANGESMESVDNHLQQFDEEFRTMWWLHQSADWNYKVNMTTENADAYELASVAFSNWMKYWKLYARGISPKQLSEEQQTAIRSMASGVIYYNLTEARIITEIKSNLTTTYSSATISIGDLNVQGESQVMSAMAKVRNPETLKSIWKSWRMQVAEGAQPLYLQLVQLTNQAAQQNGFSDVGESWRNELGIDDSLTAVLKLWDDVKNFYKELRAYAKHKLTLFYGEGYFKDKNLIPAHLLGSLWGDNWSAITDILMPYPKHQIGNLTSLLMEKGFTVKKIFQKAEEFYTKMGLRPMTESFWKKSMFEKPVSGRLVDCHPVSYDFGVGDDFRVRMCAEVKEQSLMEAIHEMGHVQYYMAYHNLPMLQRSGANSAFHEAVGETMVYAAQNPMCRQKMQLQPDHASPEGYINSLMKQALSKFVLLPWALTIEIWRYELFAGQIDEQNMLAKWWELRKEFQGVEPPDEESAKLFDPASKYHVVAHLPYMRYFISRFLEHQFIESLCKLAGEEVHLCCFVTSKKAGAKLEEMLSLGSSVPWEDALELLTGQRTISATPLLDYYRPLYDWLTGHNRIHNISI